MENSLDQYQKTRSGKIKKINQEMLGAMPQVMRQAVDLAMDITVYTRTRTAQPKILQLQEKVNNLFEMIQFAQPQNVESDEVTKIGVLANDLRQEFDELKKEVLKETTQKINKMEKFLSTKVLAGTLKQLNKDADLQINLQERKLEARREVDELKKIREQKDDFLRLLEQSEIKNQNDLEALFKKAEPFLKILKSNILNAYFKVWIPQLFTSINKLNDKKEAVAKLSAQNSMKEIEKEENQVEKLIKDICSAHKIVRSKYEKMYFSIEPQPTTKQLEQIVSLTDEWLEKSKSGYFFNLRFELVPNDGKSTYTDSVVFSIINKTAKGQEKFDFFITEYLGVRQFVEKGNFAIKDFLPKLQAIVGDDQEANIKKPLAKDENFEKGWHNYHHVDSEYRQFSGEFKSLAKEQAQKMIAVMVAFMQKK